MISGFSKVCISWQHRHLTRHIWGAYMGERWVGNKKRWVLYFESPANKIAKNQVRENVFGWIFFVFPPLFDLFCDDTPLKNMETRNHSRPIEKDDHHPVTPILGFNVSISRVLWFFFQKWSWCSSGGACRPAGHGPFPDSVCHVGKPIKVDPVDLQLTHQGLGIIRNDTVLIYEKKSSYNKIMMILFFTYDSRYF